MLKDAATSVAAALAVTVLTLTTVGDASDKPAPEQLSQPAITGSATEGETLTVSTGEWTSKGNVTLSLQWARCTSPASECVPIVPETGERYVLTPADVGNVMRVLVVATNHWGSTTTQTLPTPVVSAKAAPAPPSVSPPSNVTPPTISGTAREGEQLDASPGTWNGTQPLAYRYQWFYCNSNGTSCDPINGYTDQTYTPVADDVGGRNKVRVTATNVAGDAESFSQLTDVVTAKSSTPASTAPTSASPPTISGKPQQGQTLTASPGTWNGTAPMTYAYQWFYCNGQGTTCDPINGYTAPNYTPVADDVGGRNKVRVTARNAAGETNAFSALTEIVIAPATSAPTNTTRPAISGTPQVGATLTATAGSWTGAQPISTRYQWRRCNSTGCASIAGASSPAYVPVAADVGLALNVDVAATNPAGTATASAAPTPSVTPVPALPTERPWFADDFSAGIGRWQKEGSSPGYLTTAGVSNDGVGLAVGPSYASTGPTGSELVSVWQYPETAHAGYPITTEETWYRVRMKFPSTYRATRGSWNWMIVWHNDARTAGSCGSCVSIALGVMTDYTADGSPNVNPRFHFRLMGGDTAAPQTRSFEMPSNSLKRDHWYDLTFHFVWSKSASVGKAELWVDGAPWVSTSFPTLYTRSDGTSSYNTFGLYVYRLKASWDSVVHYDDVKIGPTRNSVN